MRNAVVVLLSFLTLTVLSLADISELLEERLEQDAQYLKAVKSLEIARQNLREDMNWFIPYIDLDAESELTDGELHAQIRPSLSFDIEGWNLVFSGGLSIDSESTNWSGWTLEVRKNLFQNEDEEDLTARAGYLEALWSVKNNANRVLKELLSEIIDSWFSAQELQLLKKELEIRRKIYEEEKSRLGITVSEAELGNSLKSILSLENSLKELEQQLQKKIEVDQPLLEEAEKLLETLVVKQETEEYYREDLKALEMRLKVAEKEKQRSFLQYLPEPIVFVRWFEDSSPDQNGFSIGLSFDWSVLDRGERETSLRGVELDYRIAQSNYEESKEDLEEQLRELQRSLESMEVSRQIAEIDLKIAKDDYERALREFEKGIITEEELQLKEIDLKRKELDFNRAHFDVLMVKLDMLALRGVDLVALVGVKR
ncbi:MAG: hypothetical protein PWP37_1173 [Thermotogota bacterium]|nr:hypothetical protein [Thermotogota bacterium]MDK2864981.1 hypothetical protein [Thermotogota bacterium]HCZ06566.1 hypothetical protein [Thermotogota bacterium]